MTLRGRLVTTIGLMVLVFLEMGFLALGSVRQRTEEITLETAQQITAIEHAAHLRTAFGDLRAAEWGLVAMGNDATRATFLNQAQTALSEVQAALEEYQPPDPQGAAEVERLAVELDEYAEFHRTLEVTLARGDVEEARRLMVESEPLARTMADRAHTLRHDEYGIDRVAAAAGKAMRSQIAVTWVPAAALTLILLVVLGLVLVDTVDERLSRLRDLARRVTSGDWSVRIRTSHRDEVAPVEHAFDEMLDALTRQISDNTRLHEEALALRSERVHLLREQFGAVVRAQEEERRRVAAELHDEAGQLLTSLQFSLEGLARDVGPGPVAERLHQLNGLTRSTMEALHQIAVDLRPPLLDDLGLEAAVREMTRQAGRAFGIEVSVSADLGRFTRDVETLVFRIMQEAVTNAGRHARAQTLEVRLIQRGDQIEGLVRDDGIGFDPSATARSKTGPPLGLLGMMERVRLLDGVLEVDSAPSKGTEVRFRVRSQLPESPPSPMELQVMNSPLEGG